jgi:hypothetical protein
MPVALDTPHRTTSILQQRQRLRHRPLPLPRCHATALTSHPCTPGSVSLIVDLSVGLSMMPRLSATADFRVRATVMRRLQPTAAFIAPRYTEENQPQLVCPLVWPAAGQAADALPMPLNSQKHMCTLEHQA